MRVLMTPEEIDADRGRWKQLRRRGVTASEIGAIMRVEHAFGSPSRSYWEKVAGDEQPDTGSMEMGRWLEPFVAERFAVTFPGLDVERGPLACHGKRRWQMCTFDLLAWEQRTSSGRPVGGRTLIPVQIKTTATWAGWGPAPHGDIPPAYLAQCLYEDDIAAVERSILAAINRGSGEIRYYSILLDADAYDDIEAMRAAGLQFLDEHVRALRPPLPDWRPATRDALKRVYAGVVPEAISFPNAARRRLLAAKRALTEAQRRYDAAENAIRAGLRTGTEAVDADGTVFATRSVYPHRHISAELLRLHYPEAAEACTVTGLAPVDKLTVKFPKEDDDGD